MATRKKRPDTKRWIAKKGPTFQIGKIPPDVLNRTVYRHTGKTNSRLIFGPGIGIDAAAVKYPSQILVFKTDPVTGTISHIGSHSVYINANDIATTGAKPVWYLATILLPLGSKEIDLGHIVEEMDKACRELGISLIGGHCEITPGITRPIVAGFMTGETKTRPLNTQNARVGDVVLMTKTAGLEGTAILASDYRNDLKQISGRTLQKAADFSKQISIVKEALSTATMKDVHALHDPTEGGILNGLWEIAEASGLGIEVFADKILVAEETKIICSKLQLDPLRLMSSGSLLIVVQPKAAHKVSEALHKMKIPTSQVARLLESKEGRRLIQNGQGEPLGPILQDELYKLA